jgi:UDP-N-acetylmuramate dehydrogenase
MNHYLDQCLRDEPLAKYSAARLGGYADYVYIARESVQELADIVQSAWQDGLPVRVLGGGANVLIADSGFRGLVVINRVNQLKVDAETQTLSVTSGTALTHLANRCQKQGISGFEWMVSVPGTVGGAVINNAGAHGGSMNERVHTVRTVDLDGTHLYTNADMGYEYRGSVLKHRADRQFLVLDAILTYQTDAPEAIRARMDHMIAYRKQTQPSGASLGSIFKNPTGDYAGRLIEASGLKGYQLGAVRVSPVHANFITNIDAQTATADDYYQIIRHVQQTVLAKTGIALELEVELIGTFSEADAL